MDRLRRDASSLMSSARDHEPNEASGGDAIPLLEETAGDERVAPYTPSSKGRLRAYWLGCVVCMGGFLCGYDSGIVGGVLTLESFRRDYGYDESSETQTNALSVGLQQLGAFGGCFLAWPITARLGRRKSLVIFSLVFCAAALVQTVNTHSLLVFYLARVLAGLGLGAATVVIPMYSSEMSSKDLRGQIGSFFQLFFTFGIFASYWIDYAVSFMPNQPSAQWQIPVGLQVVPGVLLGVGVLTLKESTRWLTRKGRHEEAWQSLRWIRDDDSHATVREMEEIRQGVKNELRETEGFQLKELLRGDNFKRVLTAFVVMAAQQATGATAFAYFGPQYFKLLVGPGRKNLLLTAIFGAVKVASCLLFVLFLAERLSRRQVLIGGAALMAVCQTITAGVVRTNPPSGEAAVGVSGVLTVLFVYLFVAVYNCSWGPLPWPYVSEIFPARIREPGVAIGVASQWLFNCVFSLSTPYMMENLGWGTFLVWGFFDALIAIMAFFFLEETRGLSLESITSNKHHQRSASSGGAAQGRFGR